MRNGIELRVNTSNDSNTWKTCSNCFTKISVHELAYYFLMKLMSINMLLSNFEFVASSCPVHRYKNRHLILVKKRNLLVAQNYSYHKSFHHNRTRIPRLLLHFVLANEITWIFDTDWPCATRTHSLTAGRY